VDPLYGARVMSVESISNEDFHLRFKHIIGAEVALAKVETIDTLLVKKYNLQAGDSIDPRGFIVRARVNEKIEKEANEQKEVQG
jgi:hypothetical protein